MGGGAGWGGGVVVLVVVEGEGDGGMCADVNTQEQEQEQRCHTASCPRSTLTDMSVCCLESYLNIHLIFLHAYYV